MTITAVREVAGVHVYDVWDGVSDADLTYEESFLLPDAGSGDGVLPRMRAWNVSDADSFRQGLTVIRLRRPLQQNLYSYLASRTELQPYQFKPILKLLGSPYGRMFIADEVGLGKTIEAGIVMTELAARGPLDRVLICCPPALVGKWEAEMRERFDQDFVRFKASEFGDLLEDPDRASAPLKAIVSLAGVRRPQIIEALARSEGRFDLVVVDESHHMQNPLSRSFDLGQQLSAAADHFLMLSATPLSLGTHNLFYQLQILLPEEFFDLETFNDSIGPNGHLNQAIRALRFEPPRIDEALDQLGRIDLLPQGARLTANPLFREALEAVQQLDTDASRERRLHASERINDLNTLGHVFSRTRKREVQDHFPARRAAVIFVRLTPEEREFYDAVTAYVRDNAVGIPGFLTIMPQRQVASSIPAARAYFLDRWNMATRVESDTLAEIEGTEDAALEDVVAPVLGTNERLADAWRACEGHDSKFVAFERYLTGLFEEGTARDDKVMVFSFFRKTIEMIVHRLDGATVAGKRLRARALYGPTSPEERHRLVEAFRDEPGPHVLVCSEVAAEGLDFQFANAMVNYDLPWNPMRVEQRIGRLDRYAQPSPVIHIANFSVEGTIEERILERLYERIGIFESAIGDLESILGNEIEELTRALFVPDLTPDEEAARIQQAGDNIVRRRHEQEAFEEQSSQLMGQDDLFTERLHDLERKKRYIGPQEIEAFVRVVMARRFPQIALGLDDRGCVEIAVRHDDSLQQFLMAYLRKQDVRASEHRAWRCVSRTAPGQTWTFTFDPEVACRMREVDFVSLRHTLVRALLDAEGSIAPLAGAVSVESSDIPSGRYVYFVYLLDIRGFRSGLELVPVVVSLDGAVHEEVGERFLDVLQRADTWPMPSDGWVDDTALARVQSAADSWLLQHTRQREADVERSSEAILDHRVESLRSSHQRWIARLEEQLKEAEATRNPIARVRRASLAKHQRNLARKLSDIAAQRGLSVGSELVAGGFLQVTRAGV